MKIAIFSLPVFSPGKQNIKDPRLDEVYKITKSKNKVYIQVELVGEEGLLDADCILVAKDACADLILKDLDFIEARLSRAEDEGEKTLLNKMKVILEREEFIFSAGLNQQEMDAVAKYSLLTKKSIVCVSPQEGEDPNAILARAVKESGFISFFTTGEKETRAWLIKKGVNAWEASGAIHSDIQKGFIRAEIISLDDFISCGGETAAKQAGKMRLEGKEYVMQDGDLTNFRFNK